MPFFNLTSRGAGQGVIGRGSSLKPYLLRQILTVGYVAAGYKDGVAWRNVNKMTYSTETTANLGDLLQEAANYTKGVQTKNTAYVFGTNGTGTQGVGAFTSTSCFNMRNDTSMTKNNNMNSGATIGDASSIMATDVQGNYLYGYANGNIGNSTIQKFNLTTETFTAGLSTSLRQDGTGATAHYQDTSGYWVADAGDTNTAARKKFVFATETESTPATAMASDGQQKGMNAKTGFGYAGNEGGYGSGRYFRKWSYATEVTVSTIQKGVWYCGEENFLMAQSAGYMLGAYTEATGGNASTTGQHNDAAKFDYSTDVGTKLGSAAMPTGTQSGTGSSAGSAIAGRSSGVPFWRD